MFEELSGTDDVTTYFGLAAANLGFRDNAEEIVSNFTSWFFD